MSTTKIAADRQRVLEQVIKENSHEKETIESNRDALVGTETADIHVNIETLYNPLSIPEQRQLSGEIFEYIEESANLYAYLVPLRAVLHGVPESEREKVPGLIKAHYERELQEQLWEKRQNAVMAIAMLVLGSVLLSLYTALALTREDSLFLELLSVVSSFALWDAVNRFISERTIIKRKMLVTAQFLSMDIAFVD